MQEGKEKQEDHKEKNANHSSTVTGVMMRRSRGGSEGGFKSYLACLFGVIAMEKHTTLVSRPPEMKAQDWNAVASKAQDIPDLLDILDG